MGQIRVCHVMTMVRYEVKIGPKSKIRLFLHESFQFKGTQSAGAHAQTQSILSLFLTKFDKNNIYWEEQKHTQKQVFK